jgi:uncharacterized protein YkwD
LRINRHPNYDLLRTGFLCVFIGLTLSLSAQTPSDAIYPDNYNKKYLEHLIKIKVDSVRAVNALPSLINDSILYVAAQYHGNYLKNTGRFSHYEEDVPLMRTPQMRVDSFGAVNYLAGENLVKSYIQKPVSSKKKGEVKVHRTYQQIAWSLVDGWVHSPGHFANIITPTYEVTGVAIAMDTAAGLVIAVQKFAHVLFKYEFDENQDFFSYSDYQPAPAVSSFDGMDSMQHNSLHAYKTRGAYTPYGAGAANDIIESRKYKMDLIFSGKRVGFSTWSTEMLYDFLKMHRKNSMALEFVPFMPYDCGNPNYYTAPSRRNGQCIYSGVITKPMKRRQLLRGFRKNKYKSFNRAYYKSDRHFFKMYLGKAPDNIGYTEVNLLFYYKKQLVRVMHLTSYCGNDSLNFELEALPDGFLAYVPEAFGPIPGIARKKIEFDIPFEQGKVDFKGENANPVLDSIRQRFSHIDSVTVRAYSSLEGGREINERLQKQRSENLVDLILSGVNTDAKFNISVQENWKLMEDQIDSFPALKSFKNVSRDSILMAINDQPDKYEAYLSKQRQAHITIQGLLQLNFRDSLDFLKHKYDSLLKVYADEESEMVDIMLATIYVTYAQLNDYDVKARLSLPKNVSQIYQLHEASFWVWMHYDVDWKDEKQIRTVSEKLKQWNSARNTVVTAYNHFIFQLKLDPKTYGVNYAQLYDEYKGSVLRWQIDPRLSQERRDSIELLLQIRKANELFEQDKLDDEVQELMNGIFAYYMAVPSRIQDANHALQIAAYFLKFDDQPHALHMIHPYADSNNLEALKLFAKLNFQHPDEYVATEYMDWLLEIEDYLKEDWCSLFIGPCNIPFQVFDYELLRNEYCEKCADYDHFVKQMARSK